MVRIREQDLADLYLRHYIGQRGGTLAAFQGSRYQNGNGLGDILRSIGRFLLPIFAPIATSAATSFIKSTSTAMDEGKSLKEAARGAIAPTVSSTLSSAGEQVMSRIKNAQSGSGRKRRRQKSKVRKSPKAKVARKRRVYKGKRKARKSKPKRVRFLNTNF